MAKIRLTESKLEKIIEKIIKEYGSYNYGGTRTIVINGGESYGDLDVPMEFPDDIEIRYKYRYESGMKSGDYDVPDDDADFYMTKPQVFIHDEDYNAMIPEIQEWVEDNWGEISGEFYEDEFEEVSNELNESKNTDNIDTLICESIMLSENVVDKFKELLKKGLVTGAIVTSLLASQNISAQDKKEVQSLAQQNNIEIQGKNFIEGNQVTSHGVGRGIDAEAARKKAVSSAKYQAAMQVVGQNENLDFSFSDVKVKKEKITKGADGNYICEITCVVTVNVNDVNLTNK